MIFKRRQSEKFEVTALNRSNKQHSSGRLPPKSLLTLPGSSRWQEQFCLWWEQSHSSLCVSVSFPLKVLCKENPGTKQREPVEFTHISPCNPNIGKHFKCTTSTFKKSSTFNLIFKFAFEVYKSSLYIFHIMQLNSLDIKGSTQITLAH